MGVYREANTYGTQGGLSLPHCDDVFKFDLNCSIIFNYVIFTYVD